MDVVEYQLFIPLLIYGIALSQLLAEWQHVVHLKNSHGPFLVTIVAFTETAVQNIYHYLEIFTKSQDRSYGSYLLALAGPFLFLLSANALSQDANHRGSVDPEEFRVRIPPAYAFMSAFVALHLLPQFRSDDANFALRVPLVLLLIAVAITKKESLIYLIGVLWLVGLVKRLTGTF